MFFNSLFEDSSIYLKYFKNLYIIGCLNWKIVLFWYINIKMYIEGLEFNYEIFIV